MDKAVTTKDNRQLTLDIIESVEEKREIFRPFDRVKMNGILSEMNYMAEDFPFFSWEDKLQDLLKLKKIISYKNILNKYVVKEQINYYINNINLHKSFVFSSFKVMDNIYYRCG